jgi:hypothetical protein
MARTIQDVRLDNKAARERLRQQKKPYYRLIENGRHIAYYRGARSISAISRPSAIGQYVPFR